MNTMTTATAGDQAAPTAPRTTQDETTGRRGRITVGSLTTGAVSALLLTFVAIQGGREPVITGAGLLGLALGWALLAVLSRWHTSRPQTWAAVPAAAMATAGTVLLASSPDDAAMTAAGWVWAPAMLAVAVWSASRARRSLDSRARTWLVLPALALLGLLSVGGGYQTVRVTLDSAAHPMPGTAVDIGEYKLHLDCAGTGSPTVILESGLGGSSTLWSRVTAGVSATTRVCAYDRAGQGWSDSADSPRDALTIAADLRALLDEAGESGPYVVVGHSAGGPYAMTFAAEYPTAVSGMVLLDATSPYDVSASAAGMAGGGGGPLALLPSLARMGLAQVVPSSGWSSLPMPAAEDYRAYSVTARAMTNGVDEVSEYNAAFAQAQSLTTLGARPLVVLTPNAKASTDAKGYATQERLAALSTNSSLRTADAIHKGLSDEELGARPSVDAILDVVQAVRTDAQVPRR